MVAPSELGPAQLTVPCGQIRNAMNKSQGERQFWKSLAGFCYN